MYDDCTILVTGGTGSFGNAFISHLLRDHNPKEIVVLSRDEKKQHDMRIRVNDPRVAFVIGDIRDAQQVHRAMRGVDYVFHAAALKQVPSCEFFPMEAVKTNVIGTNNVLEAASQCGVQKVVVLSTDKAVYPINAMGMAKALMEKLMLAQSRERCQSLISCAVRYGNVMYSRGSVIPLFVDQIKAGKPLTITNPKMTRLMLPLSEAVRLVSFAIEHGERGDILVRKAPTCTIKTLAQATLNLFRANNPIELIGTRAGEKLHEVLVSAEEMVRAEDFPEYYRVSAEKTRNYDEYYTEGSILACFLRDGYTSANAHEMSVEETEALLLEIPELRAELDAYLGQSTDFPKRLVA
ncbi:MAG: polysaccharide biosynthesis protein [Planctomycetota bacterium]